MRRGSDFCRFSTVDRGFTLVEMIIVIVITGILVGMVTVFGKSQIDAYFDVSNRAQLSDAADTALRRIGRDLQAALPNSVRVDTSTGGQDLLEFVPIHDAGRYRADVGTGGSGDVLDFTSSTDGSFDVLGPTVNVASGDAMVVYNLGQVGSDVYAGTSRRAATAGSNLANVAFSPNGAPFPFASPQHRFQIVGMPVTYECAANAVNPLLGTVLRHWNYGFQDPQPKTFTAAGNQTSVLVGDVSECKFSYTPAVLQRNGLVVLHLKLTRNGETVDLLHQVNVLNTP